MNTSALMLILLLSTSIGGSELKIARVLKTTDLDSRLLQEMGARILSDEHQDYLDIIVEEGDIPALTGRGYQLRDLVPLELSGLTDIDPEYHTFEEVTAELESLAVAYPQLCKLDSIGHAQQFNRTIWCMKVSDNVQTEEDEIAVLYIGTHHACEVMGCETLLYMINHLLENYGFDPEITSWVNNYEIFFVPLMNPDGHYAVTDSIDLFWRKNANDTNHNGIYYEFFGGTWWMDDTDGVDLNRNYDWFWEYGGSSEPLAYDFHGEAPFSEGENQAIRDLGLEQHFVTGISFHSYGEVVIYPWEYLGLPAPDQDIFDAMADELAESFRKDAGGPYSTSIYPAQSGECRNWFYGTQGGLFFCVEVNPYPVFIPPGSQLESRCERYCDGAKYLLERVSGPGITGHITDAYTGAPLYAEVEVMRSNMGQVEARYSDPDYGRFTRLLLSGQNYRIRVDAENYFDLDTTVQLTGDTLMVLDLPMYPVNAVDSSPNGGIPSKIDLSCSPNPFNASTIIKFNLVAEEMVKLSVYNIIGREIAVLFEGKMSAGEGRINWPAEDWPGGLYFVVIQAGSEMLVEKLVLLK